MTNGETLRVGMIGVGNFGAARRSLMRPTGLFDIVAAYDLNPEALTRCREEDGAQPVGSYEELLAADGIEAVVISTGAKFHAEQLIQAAERGLHVFVEKPLCSTPEELKAILEAQKRTGVVVGLGHKDHAADPVTQTMLARIRAGDLGTVTCFEKTTCHSGGLLIQPGDWRGDPARNPGGMLFQCGVHSFHELMYMFGPVEAVSCMMRYDANPNTGTADAAMCQMRFASGLIGTLNAYHVCPYRHTFSVFGTQANLYRFDHYFDEGTELTMQVETLDNSKQPRVPVVIEGPGDPASGLRNFYQAVREGGSCTPSLEDGARAVALVFACEEAAKTGNTIEVASFIPGLA